MNDNVVLVLSAVFLVFAVGVSAATPELFATAEKCLACHNRIATSHGEDVSIGTSWQASMMANAARDPYWQASVRREIMEHPEAKELIEDTCASCHMPMAQYEARIRGEKAGVFSNLPIGEVGSRTGKLAADGVSCNLCHQMEPDHFGEEESFSGGFVVSEESVDGHRPSYGPYPATERATRTMSKTAGYVPVEGTHIQSSDMCATCHTLFTPTLDKEGNVTGTLPEQVPYLEWRHSAFAEEASCQSCHMPVVEEDLRLALGGEPQPGFSRHQFRGGNAFMLRMLGRYADELGVEADPKDLEYAARVTADFLASSAARIEILDTALDQAVLAASIRVENLGGHKLPTAYPSRRAWLHMVVRDGSGQTIFESGKIEPDGSIAGNDNDQDPTLFEPHHEVIDDPSKVQIYEPILVEADGEVTTALLRASRYVKDNRILPRGFDKTTAAEEIAVQGNARDDENFTAASDTVQLSVPVGETAGPYEVEATLMYQPIGFRWAKNLGVQKAVEIDRFIRMYDEMSGESALPLAKASTRVE